MIKKIIGKIKDRFCLPVVVRWLKRQWHKVFCYDGELLVFHSAYGKFKVYYPDVNKFSQKMSYRCAKSYAEMFDGEVRDAF